YGLEPHCSPRSTPLYSGRDRSRTCKGFRLGRVPGGRRRQSASPSVSAVPAGLEPAPVWLTASRTTVVLRDNVSQGGRIRTCVLVVPIHATTPLVHALSLRSYKSLEPNLTLPFGVRGEYGSRTHCSGCYPRINRVCIAPVVGHDHRASRGI